MERVKKYITSYVKGKTPTALFPSKEPDTLPYLSPDYLRGVAEPESYAKQDSKTVVVDDGEVIVLWDGSNAGEIFISKKGILASTMMMLQFDETQLDKTYFGYSFQNLEYILKGKTAGSGIPHADKGVVGKLEIFKPSIIEQTTIANILTKVDEAIESVKNSIAAAERLKKSLMQNLLTGRMRPNGTYRNEDEFYTDEKYGKVPNGWEVKKLKELSVIQRGKFGHRPRNDERFYNGVYPFVQTSDVVNSVYYLRNATQSLNELGKSVSRSFPANTIIITIAANIGYVALTQYDVYFPDSLIGINANEDVISSQFLFLQLMQYKNILDSQSTESAQKNINYSNLRPLHIAYPIDIDEQKNIVELIRGVFMRIEQKQNKIFALRQLKKSLMQNLLTGKARVKIS